MNDNNKTSKLKFIKMRTRTDTDTGHIYNEPIISSLSHVLNTSATSTILLKLLSTKIFLHISYTSINILIYRMGRPFLIFSCLRI